MCSSPEGSVSGVSVPCVSSGLRGVKRSPVTLGCCHLSTLGVPPTSLSCLRIHSRASRHLWGSGTWLPPWGEAEDPLLPPC